MVIPVFHTTTIQNIIEPLSRQIDHLIEIHQEGEDGNPIEPLDHLIENVQKAVARLMKVGAETVEEAQDNILKRDMPPALDRVNAGVGRKSLKQKHAKKVVFLIGFELRSATGRKIS